MTADYTRIGYAMAGIQIDRDPPWLRAFKRWRNRFVPWFFWDVR